MTTLERAYNNLSPSFEEALAASQRSVAAVAAHLVLNGHSITVPDMPYQEDYRTHMASGEKGDIILHYNGNDFVVDVKHVSVDFHDANSFPFKDFMVDRADSHERKEPKPRYYFVCNTRLTHVGIVDMVKCSRFLIYRPVKMRKWQGQSYVFIFVPLGMVQWKRLSTP